MEILPNPVKVRDERMEIIRKLDYLKKRDKLTIRQIAERAGIPVGTLNKIFCGATKNPSV